MPGSITPQTAYPQLGAIRAKVIINEEKYNLYITLGGILRKTGLIGIFVLYLQHLFMKHIFTALLLLLTSFSVFSQKNDTLKQLLTQIIAHAEEASLYRNKVNWDSVKIKVSDLAKDAQTVQELAPCLKYLIKSMGDEHARIFHNNRIIAYHYGEQKNHQKTFDSDIYGDVQSGQVYEFEARLLKDNVGYVRIVGMPMGDNEQMAKGIQDKVCELIAAGAQKWILDLRYNGGGNMHPMAEGITPLIGDGYVGGSQGLTPAENATWTVKNGDFFYDDYSIGLKNDCALKSLPKVAVLTSVYTASSGEAIAVMFKNRKKTRFFGEKTMGMITVTDWAVLNESTAMTISVSYYKDRKGKVYTQFVDVDEEIPFVQKPLLDNDVAVEKALLWLKGR